MHHKLSPIVLTLSLIVCGDLKAAGSGSGAKDHEILTAMVHQRAVAMKSKDIAAVMEQFSDDATFINNAGFYCSNKSEVEAFHKKLIFREGIDYNYVAGKVTVRLIDENNALVYYPWKMDHFRVATPTEFLIKEIGLMTLSAQRRNGTWRWIAITNQYTREFFEDLTEHKARI